MKLLVKIPTGRRQSKPSAFTLVEMMFSVGIYTILFLGALIAIQIFALRVYTLAATKLTATQASRQALNQIRDDIRQGKYVQVGTTDNSGHFTPYTGTNLAVGNAIQVFSTTNGNFTVPPYDIYYLQTNTPGGVSSNNLMWISVPTSSVSNTTVLATYITNLDVFATMDCWGIIVSNAIANNWDYTIKLQFYQWEYPIAVISTNSAPNAYDYYQLRTRVSRRALN
jgi:type II secretory pathway pseudopilin PulG